MQECDELLASHGYRDKQLGSEQEKVGALRY